MVKSSFPLLPHRGDSNKYPQHMFLGVLNTVFFNISNYLSHLQLRNRSVQIVIVTNFLVISSVGIKRFDCIMYMLKILVLLADYTTTAFCKKFKESQKTTSTLQHLKQIWSRWLFKHINKNLKLWKTLRYICHIILKTLLSKEILLSLSNISFGHNVFKSRLLQWRLYVSPGDEELSELEKNLEIIW